MFWTSERVNWREEATDVGARKWSTVAIHAAEGGTGTRAGTCVCVHGHRHGRAHQCTRRHMRWQVHGHRHGRARQCTRRRMRWQVRGRVKVGGDLVEPRGIKLGDNVLLQPINATGMGAVIVGAVGARTGAGTGAESSRKASSSSSQSALCS